MLCVAALAVPSSKLMTRSPCGWRRLGKGLPTQFNDFSSDWNGNRKGFCLAADPTSTSTSNSNSRTSDLRLKSSMHLGLLESKEAEGKVLAIRSLSFGSDPLPPWAIFPQLFVSIYLILLSHFVRSRQSNVVPSPSPFPFPFPALLHIHTKTCTSLNIICIAFCCRMGWLSFAAPRGMCLEIINYPKKYAT